ncbi:ATP-binding protein [Rhodocyclus tenuis]|uniref:histidine kinase n=1 Tax=Rhodocyclus tenuis TaxID=1066 RepID=A0A840G796_RHOTE|nr:ATP-binding protein [Rhodocyclus tenuis]MBB4247755.1 signal transduction histidine kinase [Rhodocyclus tenuis]
MKRSSSRLRQQLSLLLALSMGLIWAGTIYELKRSHDAYMREAEVRTAVQAQVFAEYSRSTLKRVNEFILDVRSRWDGDGKNFSALVQQKQENIDDISFQVAVIDADGMLAFSNLAKPNERTDLSAREHFRVHKESPGSDQLFISRPVKGKVSGKWSIQLTRPVVHAGKFAGVVVVSLSPEQFAGFATKLDGKGRSATTVVRDSGEIMARYPASEANLGRLVKDRPYQAAEAPVSGNYRHAGTVDKVDRIHGYYRLPEYQLTFIRGEAVEDVLAPYVAQRTILLLAASGVSLLAVVLILMLFRSLRALDEARVQLDAIFALSPDGFVSFDADRRVKYASPTFQRLTGLDSNEIAGLDEETFAQRLGELCVGHARFQGMQALRSAHGNKTSNPDDDAGKRQLIELAIAGKRVLEVGVRLSSGGAVSQILYLRDVTHEIEVERIKSEFLSTAAHELRTPMASIYGYSELMLTLDLSADDRHEFVGIIHRQAGLIVTIINELLDLSRIEARRGKDFNFRRIDAQALLHDAIADFKSPAGRQAPVLSVQTGRQCLRGDAGKLTQALANVLSNAYKYSPDGGAVEIELLEETQGELAGMLGLRIRDQGIGMTPAQLDRVFDRFYRADTSGKIPGTGLGMSIVKEIVELHGGKVVLSSQPGEGSTVTLWIPAENDAGEAGRARA